MAVMLLIALLFLPGICESMLLVSKEIACYTFVERRECAFHYTLFNAGSDRIYNVTFRDPFFENILRFGAHFGAENVSVSYLDGGSSLFHSVIVVPGFDTFELDEPSVKSIRAYGYSSYTDSEGVEFHTKSSFSGPKDLGRILPHAYVTKYINPDRKVWATFVGWVAVPTLTSLLIYKSSANKYAVKPKH